MSKAAEAAREPKCPKCGCETYGKVSYYDSIDGIVTFCVNCRTKFRIHTWADFAQFLPPSLEPSPATQTDGAIADHYANELLRETTERHGHMCWPGLIPLSATIEKALLAARIEAPEPSPEGVRATVRKGERGTDSTWGEDSFGVFIGNLKLRQFIDMQSAVGFASEVNIALHLATPLPAQATPPKIPECGFAVNPLAKRDAMVFCRRPSGHAGRCSLHLEPHETASQPETCACGHRKEAHLLGT